MCLLIPKDAPLRSQKYLKFVRSLPCVATRSDYEIVAHHLIDCGLGGITAGKVSDLLTIPLTEKQHRLLHHNVGAWEERYGSQLKHAIQTIEKARQAGVIKI